MGRQLLVAAVLTAVLAAVPVLAQAPSPVALQLEYPDGTPVAWERWVAANGPVALVVWASWAPRSGRVLEVLDGLRKAAGEKGLSLVFVAVQEPMDDASRGLGGTGMTWFHDGRGTVLKRFRVVTVPSLVVLDPQGEVLGRLEASPEALRSWEGR